MVGLTHPRLKARRPQSTVKPGLEWLEDRLVPSASNPAPLSMVSWASPPPAPAVAVVASQMVSTVDQMIVTLENDVSNAEKALAQEIAQEATYVELQLDHLLGINPNPQNPSLNTAVPQPGSGSGMGRGNGSGSGSGGGATAAAHNTQNQPLNNATQKSGSGSGSGSSVTSAAENASKQGAGKVMPLSGTGCGTGSATISGQVWLDNNGDGSLDNGELGYVGATVNLDNPDGSEITQTTTDANGNYVFYVWPPPTGQQFEIQVLFPAGFEATYEGADSQIDTNGYSVAFNVAPGGAADVPAGMRSMRVTTTDDDPNGPIKQNEVTLRDAIQTGNNGGGPAVTFAQNVGTIFLQAALDPIMTSYNINGPGAGVLTVQGNGGPGNAYRIFTINSGVTTKIGGLTISGGYDESGTGGGGILNYGNLTLSGDVVSGNFTAEGGGGVLNSSHGSLILDSTQIQYNAAAVDGGGIANYGTVSLALSGSGNKILSNEAQGGSGGGIYNLGTANFILADIAIDGNSALFDGGGVYNGPSGTFEMNGNGGISEIAGNNSAGEYGGGLYNFGDATLNNRLKVSSNQASQKGGGLYLDTISTTTLDTITVNGNTAPVANGIYLSNTAKSFTSTGVTDSDDPGGNPVKGP